MKKISAQHLLGWGLSLADYREMFDLNEDDLSKKILDYHSGPSSFNKELSQQNQHIVSVDPIFADKTKLNTAIEEQLSDLKVFVLEHENDFAWDKYPNPNSLLDDRHAQIQSFLDDFEQGMANGRYCTDTPQKHFDLALVSHALFGEVPEAVDYHLEVINQLIHSADEVRIFPLLNQHAEISTLVGPVSLALQQQNFGVEIREVKFNLQPNGNAMLRIWPQECLI